MERLGDYALLRFKLDTGRTHQIRVHCAHMGHPILGDPVYSRCRKLPLELPGQALHAVQLGLDHPITRQRLLCEAPLPPVFAQLLTLLRRRAGAPARSQQALQALIEVVRRDAALQQQLSTSAVAGVDAVALWAREAGFDVVSRDFVDHADGALLEDGDENYVLRPFWWTLG